MSSNNGARRRDESERLRVAVIGAGWGAGLHLHGYSESPDAELVAVCSRTRSSAEEVAAEFGVGAVYTDFAEMAGGEEIDVVSVATPPSSHRDYTVAAAEHGAHVLCDKPIALNADEAEAMLRAVEERRLMHATGFISFYIPQLAKLHSLVAEGAIGEIREVHARSALGAPVLPMTWMYEADAGGGSLMQHGQHLIQIVRWISGQEMTSVCGELTYDVKETVVGPKFHSNFDAFGWAAMRVKTGEPKDLPTAEITADTGFSFAASLSSGARAYFWEAMHGPSVYSDQLEVFGSEGTLVWNARTGVLLVRPLAPPQPVEVEGQEAGGVEDLSKDVAAAGRRHWKQLVQAFLDDIRGREHAPYASMDDALRVQRVCDAVRESSVSRAWEPIRGEASAVA